MLQLFHIKLKTLKKHMLGTKLVYETLITGQKLKKKQKQTFIIFL